MTQFGYAEEHILSSCCNHVLTIFALFPQFDASNTHNMTFGRPGPVLDPPVISHVIRSLLFYVLPSDKVNIRV